MTTLFFSLYLYIFILKVRLGYNKLRAKNCELLVLKLFLKDNCIIAIDSTVTTLFFVSLFLYDFIFQRLTYLQQFVCVEWENDSL